MSMHIDSQTGETREEIASTAVATAAEQAEDVTDTATEEIPPQEQETVDPMSTSEEADEFAPRTPDLSKWPMRQHQYRLAGQDKVYLTVLLAMTLALAIIMVAVFVVVFGGSDGTHGNGSETVASRETESLAEGDETGVEVVDPNLTPLMLGPAGVVQLTYSDASSLIDTEQLHSKNAAVADVSSASILASRSSSATIYPASMTKVMTLVVAVEQIKYEEKLQDIVTITKETVDRMQREGSSGAGLAAGEKLTVEALLYALILKSDGVAACELANYIAGSEAAFADLMNQKAAEMGLTDSHFVNTTGLHDPEHYSTCRDIASIMTYAMQIPLCERILSAKSYVAPCTQPSGTTFNYTFYHSLLVTQFDKFKDQGRDYQPDGMTLVAGKTGYTPESGYCLVTCAKDARGKTYVCVTAGAENYATCVEDYMTIYETYIP